VQTKNIKVYQFEQEIHELREEVTEGEKNHKKGGWIVFLKTSSLRSEELFSGSESEVIQSLSEFRVVCSG